MNQFQELQAAAAAMYEDKTIRQWIFTHTYTQDEYRKVRHALKVLSDYKPVEWTGETGHREPVQMEGRA